ncbi:hypothetical protein AB6A40_009623 [Gnathostoma spinigerum]|uniref:UDP-glucuronic acid decarboxylase 1 n=1 Tax=Gnathostoma spinigerum TaxID=75299 RepID=A0ABD6EXN3_9BILA
MPFVDTVSFHQRGHLRHLILVTVLFFCFTSSLFFLLNGGESVNKSKESHQTQPDAAFDEKIYERLLDEIRTLRAEVDRLKKMSEKRQDESPSSLSVEVKKYPPVKFLNEGNRLRILVTGGAGFVGSHLVDRLLRDGHEVIALDNYFTGRKYNVNRWTGHPNFELVHHDVVNSYFTEVDQIYHLASPASPPHYMYNPVKTIKTNTIGTINMLGLARRVKARVLLASTSEVYGDPEVHPQPETYWGHVNTVGPRSCYDEGKRVAESLMVAYQKQVNVDIRIARIFNTFGPRMHINDGRVVSNFIQQALKGQPLTIYGNGSQTRSFQYVDDLVDGLVALMNSNVTVPVNLGNPEEYTIIEFAKIIKQLTDREQASRHVIPTAEDKEIEELYYALDEAVHQRSTFTTVLEEFSAKLGRGEQSKYGRFGHRARNERDQRLVDFTEFSDPM